VKAAPAHVTTAVAPKTSPLEKAAKVVAKKVVEKKVAAVAAPKPAVHTAVKQQRLAAVKPAVHIAKGNMLQDEENATATEEAPAEEAPAEEPAAAEAPKPEGQIGDDVASDIGSLKPTGGVFVYSV
jgi:hypothetical protein